MAEQSSKNRLPFEPRQNKKKKTEKKPPTETTPKASKVSKSEASLSAIPKEVSQRMARRMAFFSGIPTFLGITSFFGFYWLFSNDIVQFPPYMVLFFTAGCFGLGVIGLSYGIFSASWDENEAGGLVGFGEFKTNVSRTISAWRNGTKKASKLDN